MSDTPRPSVDVIIPTYLGTKVMNAGSNLLAQTITSISRTAGIAHRFIIVDNGQQGIESNMDNMSVITPLNNLGWERGLVEGMKYSDAEFVLFANDDIFFPESSMHWLSSAVRVMSDQSVAGVGPASNLVMGPQNIWSEPFEEEFDVKFLIGYCALYRRSALDNVGGVDDTLPGGDDLDISIRLRKAGHRLVCRKDLFCFHHGFVTGNTLRGTPDKPNGWNSKEMTDRTNAALIKKHGKEAWDDLWLPCESVSPKPADQSSYQPTR